MKTNDDKVKDVTKKIDSLSRGFDLDFIELVDCGIPQELVSDTMQNDLLHQIERAVIKFEITNPDLYILGLQRVDSDTGYPEVVLDWVDFNER